jgi:Ran GTPase-activating protein (RanGAP) involved in mRNA processing and transport
MSFDYHLSEAERKKVERLVPLHQAKIHLAFRADITVGDKKFKQGAVALSEHMVVVAKKGTVGASFSPLKVVHFFDIYSFSTSSETQCKIVVRAHPEMVSIVVSSPGALRFARVLVRNSFVAGRLLPQGERFQFRPHDPGEFPPFDARLSPTQVFQFGYNAFCSYANASYEHAVTQLFHAMVLSGNGVADLTRLPTRLLEVNFGHPLDFGPLFTALRYSPLVHGVVCHGVVRADIVRSAAELVGGHAHLALLDLHDCRGDGGADELAEAVRTNTKCKIAYWDLSNNNFVDLAPFCSVLVATRADIFYLNLSHAGLTAEATLFLFKALQSNKHLWGLNHLLIAGARITDEAADIFVEHVERLANHKRLALKTVDVSSTACYDKIVGALNQFQPPLQSLHIGRASFKSGQIDDLLTIVARSEHLRELNLSGVQLHIEQLDQLIWAISKNDRITEMALDFSRLALNGKRLAAVLEAFRVNNAPKFTRIAMDENEMTTADLTAATQVFTALQNLRILSLSQNFDRKDKKLPAALAKLLEIRNLQSLTLAGGGKAYLGEALLPLLRAVRASPTLLALDVSNNRIGNAGLEAITEILRENRVITELRIDGSKPTKVEPFQRVWEALGSEQNDQVLVCPFPFSDCYELVQSAGSAKRTQMFDTFAELQKRAQNKMQANQAAVGMVGDLSAKKLQELDELLDSITVAVHEQLNGVKVTEHAALSGAFGLPLPHREKVEEGGAPGDGESPDAAGAATVTEESVVAAEGMATLMFNSLCIRRPEARGQIAAPSAFDAEEGDEPEARPMEPTFIPSAFDALSD